MPILPLLLITIRDVGEEAPSAVVRKAILAGANLTDTTLAEVDWRGADLTDVDLSNSRLTQSDVADAILCRTRMSWGEENGGCKQ